MPNFETQNPWHGQTLHGSHMLKVLLSKAKQQMEEAFQKCQPCNIKVEYSDRGPMVACNTNPLLVFLGVSGYDWSRLLYQFIHEYCHILVDFEKAYFEDYKYGWLEEALCHLSSICFIDNMLAFFKTSKNIYFEDDHAVFLRYLNDHAKRCSVIPDMPRWISDNTETLERDYSIRESTVHSNENERRSRSDSIAITLYGSSLMQDKYFWPCVAMMNSHDNHNAATLSELLASWASVVPETHKKTMDKIISSFVR